MDYQDEYLKKNPCLHTEDSLIKFNELKQELLKIGMVTSLLDVGCGAGVLTKMIGNLLRAKKIVAIDISKPAIELAKEINQTSNIDFDCRDVFELKAAQKFDLVVGADIVEHISNDKDFLRRLGEVGRMVVLRLPLEDSYINRFLMKFKLSNEWEKTKERYGHVNHYNTETFLEVAKSAGLTVSSSRLFLINKKRHQFYNEVFRYITKFVALFSLEFAVKFGGGFLIISLKSEK